MISQTINLEELNSWLGNQRGIIARFELTRAASRFVRDLRMLQRAEQIPHVEIRVRPVNPEKIELFLIQTERTFRDQGYGSWALQLLCLLADKNEVTLVADVCPADDHALGLGELIEWYEEHSFIKDDEDDSWMTRNPESLPTADLN